MRTRAGTLWIIALLPMLAPAAALAADKAADIVYLKGAAVIERQARTLKAQLRGALFESDAIATRERSRAKMLFKDDSIVTLGAKSRLVVKKYLYDPAAKHAESVYELADGKLKAVVGGGAFKVTTPTAFAAARGTVFVVWYVPATGTTGIGVLEGAVSFGGIAGGPELTVTAGMMSTLTAGGEPTPLAPFDPAAGDGVVSELFETPGPDLALPEGRIEQIRLELLEQASAVATPPVDIQPAASTRTSVRVTVLFP